MFDYYYELTLWTGSILTFLVQLYTLYLISFKHTQEMKEYTYFLKLLMGYEVLFNLAFGILLSPEPNIPLLAFETKGLAMYFGLKLRTACTAFTFYTGAMIVGVQLYCLLYRYLVFGTYNNLYRGFMTTKGKIGVQLILQFLAIGLSVFFYNIFCLDEDRLLDMMEHLDANPPVRSNSFPVVMDYGLTTRLFTFFELVIIMLFLFQVSSFILLHLTLTGLRRNVGSMTSGTYRLYRQFTILLGAQLLTPLVFIFVPVILAPIVFLLHAPITSLPVHIGLLGLLFYGLINSVLTVLFITPFRRHAKRVFVFWWLYPLLKLLKLDHLISPVQRSSITRVVPARNNNCV